MRSRWLVAPLLPLLVLAACSGDESASRPRGAGAGATPTSNAESLFATLLAPCPPSVTGRVEDGLPEISLPCLGRGSAVRLGGLRGQPTVVNVWASWCLPCVREVPFFQALHEGGAVRVLGVDVLDQRDRALEFARDVGMTYPSVVDRDGDTKQVLDYLGPPHTVFIDGSGTVRHVERGEIRSAAELEELLADHLGVGR